jgi:hypothetical protein
MALNDEATVEKPHQYYTGANYLLVHWEWVLDKGGQGGPGLEESSWNGEEALRSIGVTLRGDCHFR